MARLGVRGDAGRQVLSFSRAAGLMRRDKIETLDCVM